MEKGTLIEFRLHSDRHLAVAERPEGKKHWIVTDQRGQSHTIHPRQITYEVSGQLYRPADLSKFWQQVQPYLDPAALEVAWELLVEAGEIVTPTSLALLLFSAQDPPLLYAAHVLLADDKLYFKQKGEGYEPRSAVQVAELKHQLEMEQQRQQEWQEFLALIRQQLQRQQGLSAATPLPPSCHQLMALCPTWRSSVLVLSLWSGLLPWEKKRHTAPQL
ncbi:hypothetical protein [Neosynechococcus sphagnicola]|uniref:hypothetical protein n=1 Tax=Neosynechococcus sphagnicola TaxID=1501145 RepID=UPI000AEEBCBC|nr:hypothetical protein [Neosynechococcus sphagnicola]